MSEISSISQRAIRVSPPGMLFPIGDTWCIEENVTKAEKGCFGTDKSPVFSVLTNNT